MDNIYYRIQNKTILDSEIIQKMESKDPGFDDFNLIDTGYNWSLLMYAVVYGRKELVDYLLMSDPDINVNLKSRYNNFTALHYASRCDKIEIVRELLLDARADILIQDENFLTPRDEAIQKGHLGIANMIKRTGYTLLLRIPNGSLLHDITRMIICEYV